MTPSSSPRNPRFAPANEQGAKPYVVELNDWGRDRTKVVYADSPSVARWEAIGRPTPGIYVTRVRRATPADLELYPPFGAAPNQETR